MRPPSDRELDSSLNNRCAFSHLSLGQVTPTPTGELKAMDPAQGPGWGVGGRNFRRAIFSPRKAKVVAREWLKAQQCSEDLPMVLRSSIYLELCPAKHPVEVKRLTHGKSGW